MAKVLEGMGIELLSRPLLVGSSLGLGDIDRMDTVSLTTRSFGRPG